MLRIAIIQLSALSIFDYIVQPFRLTYFSLQAKHSHAIHHHMNDTSFPILYAEDDEEDRILFLESMQAANANFSIVSVENGREVINYLLQMSERHQQPLAIVSDLRMPLCDGWDVLRMVKQHPAWRQIPVIIFSTSSSRAEISAAQHLGADAFFSKPGTFPEFIAIVQEIMEICKEFRTSQS